MIDSCRKGGLFFFPKMSMVKNQNKNKISMHSNRNFMKVNLSGLGFAGIEYIIVWVHADGHTTRMRHAPPSARSNLYHSSTCGSAAAEDKPSWTRKPPRKFCQRCRCPSLFSGDCSLLLFHKEEPGTVYIILSLEYMRTRT